MCCFGTGTNHVTTEAVVLSNRTLKCPLPRDAIKDLGPQIPFSISTNGIDYVGSAVPLTYMKEVAPSLRSLSPILGPAFGNTNLDIRGSGFQANLTCWFDSVGTPAKYLSDTHIQCLSSPVLIKESERAAKVSVSVSHERMVGPPDPESSLKPSGNKARQHNHQTPIN